MAKIDFNFEQAFNSYLNTKQYDEKTLHSYLFFYHKFINLYPEINQKNIDLFLQFNNSCPARAMIKNLKRAIIRWDFPPEIKTEIGMIDIPDKNKKENRSIPKFIKKSDVDKLDVGINTNDKFKDEELKLMINNQFYGGLRLNELINLTPKSYNFENRKPEDLFQTIKISSDSAKFGKERNAYIPTDIYKRVYIWYKYRVAKSSKPLDENQPIWTMKKANYKKLFRKWTKEILGEPYNTHSLRHGRGYNLVADEHKNIEFVKKYLGHADIGSTQLYIHLGDKEIKDELEKDKKV